MRKEQHRIPNWAVALIAIVLVVYAFTWAFTRWVPFSGKPYTVQAVFTSAQNVRNGSPVRIAGVNVGKVTSIEHVDPASVPGSGPAKSLPRAAAKLTVELKEEGRPIKNDATWQIRPRLFLEGNFFIDLRPGSPSSPEAAEGHVFPITRTSNTVQLTDVQLTVQKGVRDSLVRAFGALGPALSDYGGAKALRRILRTTPSFRNLSDVLASTLGRGSDDLSGTIRNSAAITGALARHERELSDLVANFSAVAGATAGEDEPLERAIGELPATIDAAHPALARVNALFPPLRAFARASEPGVRALGPAADAATPFAVQLEGLASKRELGGLASDLRTRVPLLARLVTRTVPLLRASRDAASCQNEIFIPFAHGQVPDLNESSAPFYQEVGYASTGISGEGRNGDANGQYSHTTNNEGPNAAIFPPVPGLGRTVSLNPFKLTGSQPAVSDSLKTPMRPNEPCDRQELPNLGATTAPPPTQTTVSRSRAAARPAPAGASKTLVRKRLFSAWGDALRALSKGGRP